jgi:predicted nucleic acid-binding protein
VARFVDSSVIVRYLTADDARRSPIAKEIVEREELVLTTLILSETAFVLRTIYDYPRSDVVDALVQILERENIDLLDVEKGRAAIALDKARSGRLSFGDALILAQMRAFGHEEIFSFDQGFRDDAIVVHERPVA